MDFVIIMLYLDFLLVLLKLSKISNVFYVLYMIEYRYYFGVYVILRIDVFFYSLMVGFFIKFWVFSNYYDLNYYNWS